MPARTSNAGVHYQMKALQWWANKPAHLNASLKKKGMTSIL
jgi:hypothetical protein